MRQKNCRRILKHVLKRCDGLTTEYRAIFLNLHHSSGSVARQSSVNLKRSVTRVARRLASRVDCRAAEPLSYIPFSFFKHSVRLASRRAAEPQNYIPYSFFKNLTRLASRRAAEPLNYRLYSFFKHLTRLASRRAAEPLNYRPYSFFKHLTRLASRRAAEPLNYRPYSFFKHLTRLASRRATKIKDFKNGPVFCSCSTEYRASFLNLHHSSGSVARQSLVNLKRSVTRVARRLASRVDCRATKLYTFLVL